MSLFGKLLMLQCTGRRSKHLNGAGLAYQKSHRPVSAKLKLMLLEDQMSSCQFAHHPQDNEGRPSNHFVAHLPCPTLPACLHVYQFLERADIWCIWFHSTYFSIEQIKYFRSQTLNVSDSIECKLVQLPLAACLRRQEAHMDSFGANVYESVR